MKDKLFVFGAYQGLTDHREAQSVQALVPSAAQRAGDFTGSGVTLQNPVDVLTGNPFTDAAGNPCVANNRIAPGCISPVATKLLSYVPTSPNNLVSSLAASPRRDDTFMPRVDWNLSQKHRVYGNFYYDHGTRSSPFGASGNIAGYIGENFKTDVRQVALNDTYTFRPTLLNEATFSWLSTSSDESEDKTIDPTELGINMPQYFPPARSPSTWAATSIWAPASPPGSTTPTGSFATA